MSAADPVGALLVIGLNHRNAPPGVGEDVFVDEIDRAPLLADIRAAGLDQAMVVATCERLEVVAIAADRERSEEALTRLMARWTGTEIAQLRGRLTVHHDVAALRHLFAVASTLDSVTLGEPHILGQIKDSHRAACEAGLVGGELERAVQAAYGVAKRVRRETALAQHPVSIAAAAIKVARQVHGDLRRATALLLGLGEMAELMTAQLRGAGISDLAVAHPVQRRAEAAARRISAHVRAWEDLESALAQTDIVVATLGDGRYTITEAMLSRVLKRRRQRPMFVMDAAVPGDVEPAVEGLDPAFVYDLGDLEQVAQEGRAQRESAALAAWRIVDAELDAFQRRQKTRDAAESMIALRTHLEALRQEVMANGQLDADAATRLLVKRLLAEPTQALREAAGRDEAERLELERSLRRLFRIQAPGGDDKKEG